MKGDKKLIEALNEILTAELTAINQYFIHAKMCENWGYHRLGEHTRGESIGEITLLMTAGKGLGTLASTIHPYPTQGEVIKKAGDAWNRGKLTPRVAALFKLFFKLF